MIEINLNEYVYVKLTEAGVAKLKADHEALGVPWAFKMPTVDDDGYTRFQLHELMHTFGPMCFLGEPSPPFKPLHIKYEAEHDS